MAAAKEPISFFQSLSSEPAVVVYSFTIFWYNVMIPNLIQQKVCSPECPPSVGFVCNDTRLLGEATDIVTTRSTLRDSLPAIILLFAGSWRDVTSLNKPIMYFALCMEIIGVSIQISAYLNWGTSPWIAVITEGVINGLGGGSKLFFIGATCAVTDNTENENRTARLTLVSALLSFGGCLAYALSGYFLTFMGYKYYLFIAIVLHIASFLLVMIFVKDKKTTKEVKGDVWIMLKKIKRTILKKRANNTIIWLMVLSSSIMNVITIAEGNLILYYLEKGFGFTIEEAGVYNSYRLMIGAISTALVPFLLTNFLKWQDFKIGTAACTMTIISCISMVTAKTKCELIFFALFDFMRTLLFGLPKSIISKCVNENEVGVFVSFCYIMEAILPIGMFYLYDRIYTATSTTLPGAFYIASAAAITVSLIFYSVSSYIYTPLEDSDEEIKNVPNYLDIVEKESQLQEKPNNYPSIKIKK